MRDRAAISRTGLNQELEAPTRDARVWVTLDSLRALEPRARAISFQHKQPARSALNGRHGSRIRGRGLDFEELRDYLPGDDVRTIDWKVTARTGTPFVRVYTEERDRPTLIVVDQRMSMFWGTEHNTKSVTAAECAAIVAFRVLEQGDRIGGIIFGDTEIAELRPKNNRAALTRFLSRLVEANNALGPEVPDVPPMPINTVLKSVLNIAKRDHLVIVISDFDAVDDHTRLLLGSLSRHNDVVLGFVTDPSAEDLPEGGRLTVSDGDLQLGIDLGDGTARQDILEVSRGRIAEVMSWQAQMPLSILPLSAAEETLPQVQRLLLGRAPG